MVFSVALELRVADFKRVAETPRAVVCGLVPQFLLLPVGYPAEDCMVPDIRRRPLAEMLVFNRP